MQTNKRRGRCKGRIFFRTEGHVASLKGRRHSRSAFNGGVHRAKQCTARDAEDIYSVDTHTRRGMRELLSS